MNLHLQCGLRPSPTAPPPLTSRPDCIVRSGAGAASTASPAHDPADACRHLLICPDLRCPGGCRPVARPHTAARLTVSALAQVSWPIYDRRAIRFAQKRTRLVMNPYSGLL